MHGHYHSLARSCDRIRPVVALLATRGESIAILWALLVLQRQTLRPLAISPLSNIQDPDLGDLRRSNTVQLAISPVRSYKNPRRPAALISLYLAVIDERCLTVYHEFIVFQERNRSVNLSRLDRNEAPSYHDLIVSERCHITTWSQQKATASLMIAIGARWPAYWRPFALLSGPIALQLRCLHSSCVSIAI